MFNEPLQLSVLRVGLKEVGLGCEVPEQDHDRRNLKSETVAVAYLA